jgi:hypothetical protein
MFGSEEPFIGKIAKGNVLSWWIGNTRPEAAEATNNRKYREKRER